MILNGWRRLFLLVCFLWLFPASIVVWLMKPGASVPVENVQFDTLRPYYKGVMPKPPASQQSPSTSASAGTSNVVPDDDLPTRKVGGNNPFDQFDSVASGPSSVKLATDSTKQPWINDPIVLNMPDGKEIDMPPGYSEAATVEAYKAFRKTEAETISRAETESTVHAGEVFAGLYTAPLAFLYVLGSMVAWVIRGFRSRNG
ncbi:hypothetical protein [Trinickia acidisoli]|uniref:hypothetical protein n=1 Tax=Trinickia acidisoli TaxID=2767482 RepID=UPI001A8DB54F|nr:hypothetical protein [Trinickia acidisoli]